MIIEELLVKQAKGETLTLEEIKFLQEAQNLKPEDKTKNIEDSEKKDDKKVKNEHNISEEESSTKNPESKKEELADTKDPKENLDYKTLFETSKSEFESLKQQFKLIEEALKNKENINKDELEQIQKQLQEQNEKEKVESEIQKLRNELQEKERLILAEKTEKEKIEYKMSLSNMKSEKPYLKEKIECLEKGIGYDSLDELKNAVRIIDLTTNHEKEKQQFEILKKAGTNAFSEDKNLEKEVKKEIDGMSNEEKDYQEYLKKKHYI